MSGGRRCPYAQVLSHRLEAEPKARIKGPWGQSTSMYSSFEVLITLYTGKCPPGLTVAPSTEGAQMTAGDKQDRALGAEEMERNRKTRNSDERE